MARPPTRPRAGAAHRYLRLHHAPPAANEAERDARMKANQKVIDAHENDWKNLGEKSAIAHAGKFKLLDKDIGLRGFEYPNNPLSLNKFSLWGNKFSRVWAPVRFGLFFGLKQ
jgi:hypothetical protein